LDDPVQVFSDNQHMLSNRVVRRLYSASTGVVSMQGNRCSSACRGALSPTPSHIPPALAGSSPLPLRTFLSCPKTLADHLLLEPADIAGDAGVRGPGGQHSVAFQDGSRSARILDGFKGGSAVNSNQQHRGAPRAIDRR
jgi:hypothetical protein